MYIAIAVAISLLIFVIVRATGVAPSRKLFNVILGVATLDCLVGLARLWSMNPILVVEAAIALGVGTVGLLLAKDNESGTRYLVALPLYGAFMILLHMR